ncbi:MAG: hypothetical protein AB8H80_14545 [Planctomycetota bacterium]
MVSPNGRTVGVDETPYGREAHRALRELCPEEPLSEAFIASVESDASRQRQAAPRRRRWGALYAKRWIAASTILLAAASIWRWSGTNTNDLDFLSTLLVLERPAIYDEERVMAAVCKLDREVVKLLASIQQQASWSPQLLARGHAAFDGEIARPRASSQALDLAPLYAQRGPLRAQGERRILSVLSASGVALQMAAQRSPRCERYANIARDSIAQQLEGMIHSRD